MPYYRRPEKRRGTCLWGRAIALDRHGVYDVDMNTESDEDNWYLNDTDTDYPDPYLESLQVLAPILQQNDATDAEIILTYEVYGTGPGEPLDYQLEDYRLNIYRQDKAQMCYRLSKDVAEDIAGEFDDEIYDSIRDTELHYEDILKIAAIVTEDPNAT